MLSVELHASAVGSPRRFIDRSGSCGTTFVRIIWPTARRWNCLDEASQLAALAAVSSRCSVRARVAAQGGSLACPSVVDRWAADGGVSRAQSRESWGVLPSPLGGATRRAAAPRGWARIRKVGLRSSTPLGALRCRDCLALHLNNRLWHDLERFGKDDLHETGPVAQHDVRQSAEITLRVHQPANLMCSPTCADSSVRQNSHRDHLSTTAHASTTVPWW